MQRMYCYSECISLDLFILYRISFHVFGTLTLYAIHCNITLSIFIYLAIRTTIQYAL